MPKRILQTIMLFFLAALLFPACGGDSGSTGDPGPDIIDACEQCRAGEVCQKVSNFYEEYVCTAPCMTSADCVGGQKCCEPSGAGGMFCYDETMCDGGQVDNPWVCNSDRDCKSGEICNEFNECVADTVDADGDEESDGLPGETDSPLPDGDRDDTEDGEQTEYDGPACNDDPHLIWSEMVDFGAVQLGTTAEQTFVFQNTGPTNDVYIDYWLNETTSTEFEIAEEDLLSDGDVVHIPVGETIEITLRYTPIDPGCDRGAFSFTFIQPTEDGAGIPCTYVIFLVTRDKGNVHPFSDPENCDSPDSAHCNDLDFGCVPIMQEKTDYIRVGNRALDGESNKTLRLYNFRMKNGADINWDIGDYDLARGGDILLAPGQTEDIPIVAHPLVEGYLENRLVFETQIFDCETDGNPERREDANHETFEVVVGVHGVQPRLCTDPNYINFGDVPLGSSETIEVELCNCGGYQLDVYNIELLDDESFSFVYNTPEFDFQTDDMTLYPGENGGDEESECYQGSPPDSDCYTMEVTCYPNQREQVEATLQVYSTSVGSEYLNIPVTCNGVGAKICSFPAQTINFGSVQFDPEWGTTTVPKGVQLWNCGPEGTTAHVCCLELTEVGETPLDTFGMQEFTPWQPMECGEDPNLENCFALNGGTNPNYLTFEATYSPTDYGEHKALLKVVAEDNGWPATEFIEVKGEATDCEENWYDLSRQIPGCEYYCEYQGPEDEPDMDFIDSNCDGIDGNIDKAIFVSTLDGNNMNPGTWDEPLKTIPAAISAAAIQQKTQIYVAMGSYMGRVSLSNAGIGIYGGYSGTQNAHMSPDYPRGWVRDLDNESRIVGNNIGLHADFISKRTQIQLMSIFATDGTMDDPSSYGIYARYSDALILEYVTVESGNGRQGETGQSEGADGKDGEPGERGQSGAEDDSSWYCGGSTGALPGVGIGGRSDCGERGGNGGLPCKTGGSSCAGSPGQPGSQGAYGGSTYSGGPGSQGGNGDTGYPGDHGAGGTAEGEVVGGRWYPGTGQPGERGGNGGGGGGGGGGGSTHSDMLIGGTCEDWGGAGGGGGSGGCGGGGGLPGMGGGSSFGIFLFDSSPEIVNCAITTGDGGDGGDGRGGGRGGSGGRGGAGGNGYDESYGGGPGGNGGSGGQGGSGGGGAGGNSIGIYKAGNSVPILIDNTINLGFKGFGGSAGHGAGNDGEDGAVYEIYPPPARVMN